MSIVKDTLTIVLRIVEIIVFIGTINVIVYVLFLTPTPVLETSMEPTLKSDEHVIVSKITYKLRSPERGDIVSIISPYNSKSTFIKRIVGLPTDVIVIRDHELYVNDILLPWYSLDKSTINYQGKTISEGTPFTVPPGHIFVLSDQETSVDSRAFGPVPFSSIDGVAVFRFFPLNKIGFIINPFPKHFRK